MDEVAALLSNLTGVIDVAMISTNNRDRIRKLESNYEQGGVIGLQNLGIRMVLACDRVYAILKDTAFRPPPGPTVFMVEDQSADDEKTDHIIKIGNNNYRVVGEEIIGKKLTNGEDYMFLSADFIIYSGRRKGRRKKPAYFLIPPIGFPELERVRDSFKISNIMSVSPSAMADRYIRELCAFSPQEDLATILVGCDREK